MMSRDTNTSSPSAERSLWTTPAVSLEDDVLSSLSSVAPPTREALRAAIDQIEQRSRAFEGKISDELLLSPVG
jgi:hypothetical protein